MLEPDTGQVMEETIIRTQERPHDSGGVVCSLPQAKRSAEEQLRTNAERYRLLADTMLQGVVHQDAAGTIIAMNPAAEEILGKSCEEFLGSSSVQQEYHTLREDGTPFPGMEHPAMITLRTRRPVRNVVMGVFNPRRNEYRWITIDSVPLCLDETSQEVEVYTVFTDITEKKQTEETLRQTLANLEQRVASRTIELEQQVAERTAELTMINTSLTREIGERLRIEQDILEQQQLLQEMAQEMAMAEDRERDRIAVELHDQVNQRLVLAKMKVEALGRKLGAPALEKTAEGICDLLAQIIEDTRSLTAQIRPPLLAGAGLEAAIEWLGEELLEQYGLRVELYDDGEAKTLEYGLRSFVFQAVRELLVNVAKHAGTPLARVEMRREGQHLVITVADQGCGFDPVAVPSRRTRSGGFGLFAVRQKIEYLGGVFQIDSRPGAGASVTIRMLLAPAEAPEAAAGNLKILLVDDQSFVREGLRALIEGEPGLEVIAEAGTGRGSVAMARELRPDVVVMDLNMADMNGIDATRAITSELEGVRVVAFSVEADRRFVVGALKAGASGYVHKDSPFAVLAAAIRAVAVGETYLGPRISEVIIREYLQRIPDGGEVGDDSLTAREREILQLIAVGKSTKEIAFALGTSNKTVDGQRQNIMNKLNLYSTAELTKYAIREGLTPLK